MNNLSFKSWLASGLFHGLAVLPLVVVAGAAPPQFYDTGDGQDAFKLEQGLTFEMTSLGDATERVEIAEQAPLVANPVPPPIVENKPLEPELTAVITAKESPVEVAAVAEEAPPPVPVMPQEVAVRDQAAQVAVLTEKSAGAAQSGGTATALSGYIGKIHGALQKVKLDRRVNATGKVIVGLTVDPAGRVKSRQVIVSSGIASIDKAAMEMVDKAAFPPPPDAVDKDQLYEIPFSWQQKSKSS
jgi:TonB family protein